MHVSREIYNATVLEPLAATLGESPVWHSQRQACFWVDIESCRIYEYDWKNKTLKKYDLRQRVSLVVPSADGQLILALQGGIARFNPDTSELTWITDMGLNWTDHRCNDGACDSKGRLWIGTMELDGRENDGDVYCLEKNGPLKKKIERVSISNGIAWSADNRFLYYTDSLTRQVVSYHFDEASGNIAFDRIAVQVPQELGLPDGIALDEEGALWIALWGGYGVSRWDLSSGKMIGFVELPVPQASSCAFAGDKLDQLVITTARKGMSAADLALYPGSGHIFIVRPGVRGLPAFTCGF